MNIPNGVQTHKCLCEIYHFFLAISLIILSKQKKTNLFADIFLLDFPGILAITYFSWRRSLFNSIDYDQQILRSYLLDQNIEIILLTLGCLLLGVELFKYKEYFKKTIKN